MMMMIMKMMMMMMITPFVQMIIVSWSSSIVLSDAFLWTVSPRMTFQTLSNIYIYIYIYIFKKKTKPVTLGL